ncbi:HNH endonuclease [Paracoccus yeei]|uniref:HNH endonuclease n=1 Tax=Paracoccus yeei TaxID=147645 RepID=UPI003BF8775C
MARLPTLKPRLSAPLPKLQAPKDEAGRSKFRDANTPGRAMMRSRKWRGDDAGVGGLRWHILKRDLFTCRICGAVHTDTRMLEADHIVPHKGDPKRFWDKGNLWCVCGGCHRTVCQRIEARHAGYPDLIREAKAQAARGGLMPR